MDNRIARVAVSAYNYVLRVKSGMRNLCILLLEGDAPMSGSPKARQPRPSYEEGKVRDPRIKEMQDRDFSRDKFLAVVKKSVAAIRKPDAKHEE